MPTAKIYIIYLLKPVMRVGQHRLAQLATIVARGLQWVLWLSHSHWEKKAASRSDICGQSYALIQHSHIMVSYQHISWCHFNSYSDCGFCCRPCLSGSTRGHLARGMTSKTPNARPPTSDIGERSQSDLSVLTLIPTAWFFVTIYVHR